LIESELTGQEYGIDAIVVDNQCTILSLRAKVICSPPYRVTTQYIGPIILDKNLTGKVKNLMQACADTLDLNDCLMHADIMIDTIKNEISIIEASGRPSGFGLSLKLILKASTTIFNRPDFRAFGSIPIAILPNSAG
jgi:hypothetical protein